jgi:hypothetical protein
MVGLKPGSPSYRFFAGLKAVAERNIRRVMLEDEEEFD